MDEQEAERRYLIFASLSFPSSRHGLFAFEIHCVIVWRFANLLDFKGRDL